MIDSEDFERALRKDSRKPVSADVLYSGRDDKVTYLARDFSKIRFPVRKLTIQYAENSGVLFDQGNGDLVRKDRKKVRS